MRNKVTDLRVLSGRFKGAKLCSPLSLQTHPMGAREKLALFNRLEPYIADASVLDAYAGSGALGIEALSRGAGAVAFVEHFAKAASAIRENLARLDLAAEVCLESVNAFSKRTKGKKYFEIVLADPPYDQFDFAEVQSLADLVAEGGVLALSYSAGLESPQLPGMEMLSDRKYAGAKIALYQRV